MRAAVVGWGDVAVVHREAIDAVEGAELVGVVDTDPARRAAATADAGVPAFATIDELVGAVAPDVVHVTTPHDQHAAPTLEALAHGVHVLQEKPLAHTLATGVQLVERIGEALRGSSPKPRVGVCFQNRYNVSAQELRRLLDSGELGAVRGAYASVVWTRAADYYTTKPWRGSRERSGGGLLINQAIHTLDLLQWFLGEPTDVRGHVATHKFGDVMDVEDTAELLITHPGGVQTSFYATLTAPRHRPVEIELKCEHADVVLRNGLTVVWHDGRVERHAERQVPSGGRTYWGVSHELLIRDFYATLGDPEPFWISPADALASLRILTRAYEVSGL